MIVINWVWNAQIKCMTGWMRWFNKSMGIKNCAVTSLEMTNAALRFRIWVVNITTEKVSRSTKLTISKKICTCSWKTEKTQLTAATSIHLKLGSSSSTLFTNTAAFPMLALCDRSNTSVSTLSSVSASIFYWTFDWEALRQYFSCSGNAAIQL